MHAVIVNLLGLTVTNTIKNSQIFSHKSFIYYKSF